MLNDGYPVDGELIAALQPGPAPDDPLLVLPDTGLVRAAVGDWHLLADVGPPGPPSAPGHAHADTFGCLMHVDGIPLLVDTGTSTYEPGPVRRYERSTAAHSTVQVDGADSTEVWGVFRAARRARVSGLAARPDSSGFTCEAVHDGFRRLPGRPLHRRRWSLTEGGLRVDDLITGRGRHEIVVRWQLAVGSAVQLVGGTAQLTGPAGAFRVAVEATGPVLLSTETRQVAAGFGRTADAPVLACRMDASLPVRVSTVWTRTRGHAGGRIRYETGRAAGQRREGRGARRSPSGDQPDRGSGAHHSLGDLRGHRTSGHRARQVQPARQGAGPAGLGTPGRSEGAGRGHREHGARGQGQARLRPAPRLLRSRGGHRGRRRRRRDRVWPACGDRRCGQGQPRRVPGRARLALRGRARGGAAAGRGVRHPRVHPAACAAAIWRRAGLQGGGARPRAGRPARGTAGDGLRLRRGRDRPRRVRQENRGRRGRAGAGRDRRRDHEPDPRLVPGTGRGHRAGLRRRSVG